MEKKKSGCLKKIFIAFGTLCLLPFFPLLIIPAAIGIWYYAKRKPNARRRNISMIIAAVGLLVGYSYLQTPTSTLRQEAQQLTTSSKKETKTSSSSSQTSTTSSKKKEEKSKDDKKKAEEEKKKEEAKKAEEEKKKEEARKAEEAKKLLENAETSVKNLEANQVSENIAGAEESVNKITDPTKKEEFQHRIDLVKNAISQREEEARKQGQAEQAVQALENNQVPENIAPAQEAVNQISDENQKQALQHRIGLVQNAINVRAEEARRQQEAAAAAQAAQAAAQQPAGASYRNCSEARAAGAAPIYRGQPGYAPHLDRDGDGIACER